MASMAGLKSSPAIGAGIIPKGRFPATRLRALGRVGMWRGSCRFGLSVTGQLSLKLKKLAVTASLGLAAIAATSLATSDNAPHCGAFRVLLSLSWGVRNQEQIRRYQHHTTLMGHLATTGMPHLISDDLVSSPHAIVARRIRPSPHVSLDGIPHPPWRNRALLIPETFSPDAVPNLVQLSDSTGCLVRATPALQEYFVQEVLHRPYG